MRAPPVLHAIGLLPRRIVVAMIDAYQHTLSPDHGPLRHRHPYGYCRHEPTCSMYAKQVITSHGLIIGGFRSLRRLLSCTPWSRISDEKWRALAKKR